MFCLFSAFLQAMEFMRFEFAGLNWEASTLRTLYLPAHHTLLISDCHFGKATHFRKNHIPIPQTAAMADYVNLQHVLNHYQPQVCIFLGDLFHSSANAEWKWLSSLRQAFGNCQFLLIQGNHDILMPADYEMAGFDVVPELLLNGAVTLLHNPPANPDKPVICGHLHPGFTLRGKARQYLSVPCYYIKQHLLIMPAFGSLTGHINMDRKMPGGKALCIAGNQLFWTEP